MAIEIWEAIKAINPLARYGMITEDGVTTINWLGGTDPIEQSVIDAKVISLQAEYDVQEYARNRRNDYPDTGAQFNKIYDDGLTKWKSEMVDPVKTKWPKDNSGPV